MKTHVIAAVALWGLAACAVPVEPTSFDGNATGTALPNQLIIPSTPLPVPAPTPVSTTSLDGPARTPVPLPSTNGMPPPPVEVGVVGPPPLSLPPLVMDEDIAS